MMLDDKIRNNLSKVLFVATALVYIYTSGFGALSEMTQRALLLTVCGFTVFLLSPIKIRNKQTVLTRALDWVCALAFIATGIYIMSIWTARASKVGAVPMSDLVMATIMIILLLIATFKTTGLPLVVTSLLFLAYAKFGPYLPSVFAHRGETWARTANFMYVSTVSIFGVPLGIASTYIISFVIFGAFLEKYGAGQWFVDISYALTGKYRGGPAKTSVVSSALMGMISGSPAANVVTTGTFTIPLMRKTGYADYEAAAVESVASTGGMFTPPIMGAAAFMMAEFLNIPYMAVAKAAIVPACLYYLALILGVDAIAVKRKLIGVKASELPDAKDLFLKRGQLGLPIIFVIAGILIGWSAMKVAFWGIISVIAIAFLRKETRPTFKDFINALEGGVKNVSGIVISCATAGIIVGVISMTGLATKLSYTLMNLTGGSLLLASIFTALITIVLGCGMPPTPTYVILATVLVDPLVKMGAAPISAHMFIFIFSCIGALTPPVAITAYTAAAIAKSDPNKTGLRAFRMGLVAYLIPFIFLINPAILMVGDGVTVLFAILTASLGIFCLSGAVEGYVITKWFGVSRVFLFASSILLMTPGGKTDFWGFLCIAMAIVSNLVFLKIRQKGEANATLN